MKAMDQSHLFLVIMAGGSGTRFWPKSNVKCPKQLLSFENKTSENQKGMSLLSRTISRFDRFILPHQRIVVTTQLLKPAVQAEAPEISILAEPEARNTAPCIYWAAQEIVKRDPEGLMLVMPSDHHILQPEEFLKVVLAAIGWVEQPENQNDLVTLGIRPLRPETGYGYLKIAGNLGTQNHSMQARKVEAFVEKPNREKASQFIASGQYLWNGGMFVWRAQAILQAFNEWMPEMKRVWEESQGNVHLAYPRMTATSIDYGIMEKAKNVVTFSLDCGWDDLGSWTSLEYLAESLSMKQGSNVVVEGQVLALESHGNIIDVPGRFVSLLGVDDLIVVEQGEVLLLARKDRAQEIRRVVEEVKKIRQDLI